MFIIQLGSKVKSSISGFTRIVIVRAEHLNGCNRYWVYPPVDKDGKLMGGSWFDEGELVVKVSPVLKRKNQDRGGFPSSVK